MVEVEPIGKRIAAEHRIEPRPINDRHHLAQHLRLEPGLVQRAMVDRVLYQRPAGGDQRHVDLQLLDQRQGVAIAASRGQHNVDACLARPRKRRPRGRRQFVAAVDQRSVDVDGKKAVQGRRIDC